MPGWGRAALEAVALSKGGERTEEENATELRVGPTELPQ